VCFRHYFRPYYYHKPQYLVNIKQRSSTMSTLRTGSPELSTPDSDPPAYTGTVQPNPVPPSEYQSPVEAVPGVGGIPGVSGE
jgi:hypothetical protein